jgi:hypothetical protein
MEYEISDNHIRAKRRVLDFTERRFCDDRKRDRELTVRTRLRTHAKVNGIVPKAVLPLTNHAQVNTD